MAVGVDLCRITVRGPLRRCDLALPASATVGELIPLLLRLTADPRPGEAGSAGEAGWALHRLGGPALDLGATAEQLGLREGEVLYLGAAESVPAEAVVDDVGAGLAEQVRARPDFWRPERTREALTVAACLVLAGYAAAAWGLRPAADRPAWFYAAAIVLAGAAVPAARRLRDTAVATVCALGACLFGAAGGPAALPGPFVLDRRTLILASCGAAVPAVVAIVAGRLSTTLFGAVLGAALCGLAGGLAAAELGWSPAQAAAALAVVLFGSTAYGVRIALRAARLRVAQLPRTADELQEDVAPDTAESIRARASAVTAGLGAYFSALSAAWLAAALLLARSPDWSGRTLAAVLGLAILLRAGSVAGVRQRAPMLVAGCAALVASAVLWPTPAGSDTRVVILLVLALSAAALLVAVRRLPGRRLLPLWGQLAERLELATALALVPLLFEVFHLYAYFRALAR